MVIDRREFVKLSGISTAAFLIGCNQNTIASYVAAIGNTPLGQEFQAVTATAIALITNYKTGQNAANVIAALNALLKLTDSLGLSTPYEPLIAIIVAGIEGIISLLPTSTPVTGAMSTNTIVPYAVQKRAYVKPITMAQFKALYNAEIPTHPELAFKKL